MQKMVALFLLYCGFLGMMPAGLLASDKTDEQLAAQYFREGDYERAAAIYERLYEEDPSHHIYNNYLVSLLELEEYRIARRLTGDRQETNPGDIRYAVDQGWVQQRAGNERRARRHFDGLIDDLQARYPDVVDLANAFETRGYTDRALETLQHGRKLLDGEHPLHFHIAEFYEKQGDYQSMMEEYLDYLNEYREDMNRVRGIIQDAIAGDPDFSRNEALRKVLLARTQRHPDNILYAEMLLWLSMQQQDFRMAFRQARALDRRLGREGELVLEVAELSTRNEYFEVAAEAYQYLLDQGEEAPFYLEALVGFLNVRFLAVTSGYEYDRETLEEVEQEYLETIDRMGIRGATVQLVRNLARLQAFYLGRTDEATRLLEEILDLSGVSSNVKGECRIELADILLLTGEVWDATLLYSQVDRMFRNDPLAHEARFKNARLSYFIGEFDWAKAQLDVLKAGTSRLIANDAIRLSLRIQDNVTGDQNTEPLKLFARAEQHIFMHRYNEAEQVLDSIRDRFPDHQINDDVLFARSEIMEHRGNYEAVDSLLTIISEEYPRGLLADEAVFNRAELQHQYFENHDKAMELYQRVMIDYPGSIFTLTARNRFRALRGDMVN
ncbi:MAG: tetratricopeptide repeat protein [Bacteroidales bacterium]